MFRIECFRDVESISSIKSDWDRLAQGAMMRRLSWLLPWYSAYESTYRLCVLVAYRGAKVCGIFPLVESKSVWTGNTLSFMGSGKVCTDDCGIICLPLDETALAAAFAKWLVDSPEAPRWDHLNLDGVRETNQSMAAFGESIRALVGSEVIRKPSPNCWSASLEGGVDAYKSRLSKRARKILLDARREEETGRSEFQIADTLSHAHLYLEEVSRLHQLRWKERGIEGCFSDDCFRNFLHGALNSLWSDPCTSSADGLPTTTVSVEANPDSEPVSSSRRVHIVLLKIEGRAASGAVCIRDRDALDVYLTGMNPEFAEVRPGWQLMQHCIEHASNIGCERIDFLRGDEEYKARLGAQATKQERWVLASPRLTSQIRSVAYRTASSVKNWWNAPVNNKSKVEEATPVHAG